MADVQRKKGGGRRAQRGNARKRNESELGKSEEVSAEKGGGVGRAVGSCERATK